ncbi:PadR family transcriptional regulator [Streptomyces sp. XD-27]|uniref:PadR family transcriptional regulator n=1 Tax=Streptomyces sp. XD-27 TaxID=3062779 RepID=UPI0026F4182F|nr:PadR family transcriptional regulator [Streptomyces sp. XD-27]WKX71551.1 PadR family transcriptional regulator [Streptomyces sp. XD-27]
MTHTPRWWPMCRPTSAYDIPLPLSARTGTPVPCSPCVLHIISSEETYGYAITRRLNELGFTDVVEGTVYTILMRLERKRLVQVTKRPSGQGPPRKFFALNDAGREQFAAFWTKWDYLSSRIDNLKEGGR